MGAAETGSWCLMSDLVARGMLINWMILWKETVEAQEGRDSDRGKGCP